jgi:hypothetical protein
MTHLLHPRGSAEVDRSPDYIKMLNQERTTSPSLDLGAQQSESTAVREELTTYNDDADSRQGGNASICDQSGSEADALTQNDSLSSPGGPLSRSSKSVLWRGLSFTSLVWETVGVILSIFFLGTSEFACGCAA